MADYGTLPLADKIAYATSAALKEFGITPPVVSQSNKNTILTNANRIAGEIATGTQTILAAGANPNTPVPLSSMTPTLRATVLSYVPPGYTVSVLSWNEIASIGSGIVSSLKLLVANPPAPVASSQSNNTLSTVLGVGAAALGAIALVKAFTPQAVPAAVPAAAVVPPPIVTSPAPPAEVAPASDPAVNQDIPVDNVDIPIDAPPVVNSNADTAGEAAAQQNVAMMKSLDDTGIDAQIAANAASDAVIADQVAALSEQNLETPPDLMAEAIQAQVDADADYAFDTGYNNVQDQKDAENQQALDQIAAEEQIAADAAASELQRETNRGLTSESTATKAKATSQDVSNFKAKEDWRVRLSLAPGATYLYKVGQGAAGILNPLQKTDGVIFPYTPNIQVTYAAQYKDEPLTHSNYKIFQYSSSSVDSIQLTCDFTAQDTDEADYLLAVIHFFKSVTKMFYGQDENPSPGVPPPLCYLTGLGQFQFDAHPLAITSFNYVLPTDVDYIRSGSGSVVPGANTNPGGSGGYPDQLSRRLSNSNLQPGGAAAPPKFNLSSAATNTQATYVPTKMVITLTAIPIVSRNDISTQFSLKKYATGELLQGTKRNGGGIW